MRARLVLGTSIAVLAGGLLPATAGAAAADRPDTLHAAKQAAVSANGTWLPETLSSASDRDYFRFTVSSAARALVTLGHLPADYALTVYDAHGSQVAAADRSGRRFEQIYTARLAAGDYFVRVTAAGAAYDASVPYVVQFRPLRDAVVFAEHKGTFSPTELNIRGELLNNTDHRVTVQRLHVVYLDKAGNPTGTHDEGIRPGPIAAHKRAEFHVHPAAAPPAGTTSYRITVRAASTKDPLLTGASMTRGSVETVKNTRHYTGTVTNTTNQPLHNVYPTVIEYDSRGRANAFGYDHIATLKAGQTVHYSIYAGRKGLGAPNATRIYADVTG